MCDGKLQDLVALVTGASGGIGKATAVVFAKEGAKVRTLVGHRNRVERTIHLYILRSILRVASATVHNYSRSPNKRVPTASLRVGAPSWRSYSVPVRTL